MRLLICAVLALTLTGCGGGDGGGSAERIENASLSGRINSDQIWAGTIRITGDIVIAARATVTIEPGTMILVAANSDDTGSGGSGIVDEATAEDPSVTDSFGRAHSSITVYGTLIAVGTEDAIITFTSDAEEPTHTDWGGFGFFNGSSGELKFVLVEWIHSGPALHSTDDVKISYSTVRHTFWGALHAFECSPVFEYNTLYDIGHEAIDTHKASPTVRFNSISQARTGAVLNFHAGAAIIFEFNTVRDCGATLQLQENPFVKIRNNTFIASKDTGGPWTYQGFSLTSSSPSSGLQLADNVDVEITGNTFRNYTSAPVLYDRIGPNMGIGHTTDTPEPFDIGPGPVNILVQGNTFINCDQIDTSDPDSGAEWQNFTVSGNTWQ